MNGEFKIFFQPNDSEEERLDIQFQCELLEVDLRQLINDSLKGGSVTSSDFERREPSDLDTDVTRDFDGGVHFKYTCGSDDPTEILNKVELVVAKYDWHDRMSQHAVH